MSDLRPECAPMLSRVGCSTFRLMTKFVDQWQLFAECDIARLIYPR